MAMFKMLNVVENALSRISKKCCGRLKYTSKTSNIEELIGCPEKPKQPINAFLRFFLNYATKHGAQSGNKVTDLTKTASITWKGMTESEKEIYFKEFEKDKLLYQEKLEAYNNALTQSQKDGIIKLKKSLKKLKEQNLNSSKSELKSSLKKPEKPLTPYIQFCKTGRLAKQDLETIGEQWRKLPESEKNKYKEEFKRKMEKYSEDLKKWELKMFLEGNIDVLRMKTLKFLTKKYV